MVNTERMKRTFTELVSLYAPSKGEREVCEYLKKKLKSLGASKIIEDNDGSVNGGNCRNLIAVWNGNAPGLPSIALTAHMDCVEHCKDIEPILEGGVFTSKGDTILGGDDKAGVTAILEGIALMKEMYIRTARSPSFSPYRRRSVSSAPSSSKKNTSKALTSATCSMPTALPALSITPAHPSTSFPSP